MSRWRRIAMEEMPSCKRTIEEAPNVVSMWMEVYEELAAAYNEYPRNEGKIREIYKCANYYWYIRNKKKAPHLSWEIRVFFEPLILNSGAVFDDAVNRIPRDDYKLMLAIYNDPDYY